MSVGRDFELAMRKIYAQHSVAGVHVIEQSRRHEAAYVFLRLFSAAPNVRRKDHVWQTLQRTAEWLIVFRFLWEHVHGSSLDFSAHDGVRQRLMIDHNPATQIQQTSALLHRLQFAFAKK